MRLLNLNHMNHQFRNPLIGNSPHVSLHFPLCFLMFHVVIPRFLLTFPMFPLVFLRFPISVLHFLDFFSSLCRSRGTTRYDLGVSCESINDPGKLRHGGYLHSIF